MLELIGSASMGADMGIGCRGSDCVMGPRDCVYPLEMSYCGSARRSHREVSRFSIHADSRAASMRREKQQKFPLLRGRWRGTAPSLSIQGAGGGCTISEFCRTEVLGVGRVGRMRRCWDGGR